MAYKYIFGPVPSRRLGLSLGVDLMRHKTCSLDCIYCECGKTTHLTLAPKAYVPLVDVKQELKTFLSMSPDLDYITFSGSGEPTLHSGIGEIALFVKSSFPRYKLALLTNGTLLHREEVRQRLLSIDVVVVSVDAATKEAFQKVNRPHPKLTLDEFESGLVLFRDIFKNSLWAEVFLVPGCNTSQEELAGIRKMLQRFRPDKIQVNTLDRPGTESWATPLENEQLNRAASFLQVTEPMPSAGGRIFPGDDSDLSSRLFSALRRRPLTVEDVSRMLGMDAAEALGCLDKMVRENTVKRISMPRGTFYMVDTV